MSQFVEKIRPSDAFELCGRIRKGDESLQIFIDDIGEFTIPVGVLMATIMGLGDGEIIGPVSGIVRLSESGKGMYLDIDGVRYVTPVSRVRAVMGGIHRKGPVSRVR